MKKILAAIVEYKLTKMNLQEIMHQLLMALDTQPNPYPPTFSDKMRELALAIYNVSYENTLSLQDEELVMDMLKEMECMLVDYLTQVSSFQTNDCFLS